MLTESNIVLNVLRLVLRSGVVPSRILKLCLCHLLSSFIGTPKTTYYQD